MACLFLLPSYTYCKEFVIGINERDIFRYKDENGDWAGKDIDLINDVFSRTSHQFKIISMPWQRVLKGLESGTVDMTLSASRSPERELYAFFSGHIFRHSHYMLFVLKSKLPLFESATQLSDLVDRDVLVGVLRGAIYSSSFNALLQDEKFVNLLAYVSNDKDLPSFVLKERVDAYIDSEIEGKYYLSKQPEYHQNVVPLFRITSDIEAEGRLMFSRKTVSQILVDEFDQALKALHESGAYDKIAEKYSFPSNQ